jgi:hypothetical protein
MLHRVLVSILILIAALSARAQLNPDTLWTSTIAGLGDERIYDLDVQSDGYLIAGRMTFNQDYQGYVGKLSPWGSLVWSRLWGGSDSEVIKAMCHASDDAYLFVGETISFGAGGTDIMLIGANIMCDSIWSEIYGGSSSEWAAAVEQTFDGGFIIAGSTASFGLGLHDFYVLKTTRRGVLSWSRTYGTSLSDDAYAICQTPDSGYAVFGTTQSTDYPYSPDIYVVRIKANGDTLWNRRFGSDLDDVVYSAHLTSDHGFIMAGYESFSDDTQKDCFIMKLDSAGTLMWANHFGGVGDQIAYSVQQTSDHGYVAAGYTLPLGATHRSVYMFKTDSLGHFQWDHVFPCTIRREATVVKETDDGGYVLGGFSCAHAADGDLYVIKTGPDASLSVPGKQRTLPDNMVLTAYPNPFNPQTVLEYTLPASGRVELTLYNITGRRVRTLIAGTQERGLHRITMDGSDLAAGLYIARLTAPRLTQTQKLLLIK